jgi:hypothetical protein
MSEQCAKLGRRPGDVLAAEVKHRAQVEQREKERNCICSDLILTLL